MLTLLYVMAAFIGGYAVGYLMAHRKTIQDVVWEWLDGPGHWHPATHKCHRLKEIIASKRG